jgi:hypothetical protein
LVFTFSHLLQEAELRRNSRLEAIKKANELLYDQTDKMKMFRSQKLYGEVVYSRQFQMEDKKKQKELEKEYDRQHHEHILKTVGELEDIEKAKIAKQQALIDDVKVSRKQQLDEVNAIREANRQRIINDGLKMKQRAEDQLQEEILNFEMKQKSIADSNAKMVVENEKLKRIREELKEKERQAELAREAEIGKIEHRKLMLKQLEVQRFEKAQATRQKLIDTAIERLAAKSTKEEALLQQQMQDLKDKEDRLLEEKRRKNEEFRELIAKSRVDQIEQREKLRHQEYDDEMKLVNKWRKENEDAMQAEIDKQQRLREETTKLKNQQYDEGMENARKRKENKMIEVEQARFLHSIRGNDDAGFVEACKQEIERNIALGKPVYTLLKALEFSANPLIAAKTVKVDRKPKSS